MDCKIRRCGKIQSFGATTRAIVATSPGQLSRVFRPLTFDKSAVWCLDAADLREVRMCRSAPFPGPFACNRRISLYCGPRWCPLIAKHAKTTLVAFSTWMIAWV